MVSWSMESVLRPGRSSGAQGLQPPLLGKWLGAEMDRAGRVKVMSDLSVPGHPDVFVISDTASIIQDGKPLPGVAPVAMQV
jgi:NADH dehydrogenase